MCVEVLFLMMYWSSVCCNDYTRNLLNLTPVLKRGTFQNTPYFSTNPLQNTIVLIMLLVSRPKMCPGAVQLDHGALQDNEYISRLQGA